MPKPPRRPSPPPPRLTFRGVCTHPAFIAVGALVLALALFLVVETWRGRAAFAAQQASLKADGEPAALADLRPPRIPDEENFAAVPWILDLARGGAPALPEPGKTAVRNWIREMLESPGSPAAEGVFIRIGRLLAPVDDRLAGLREAARLRSKSQFRGPWHLPGWRPDRAPDFNYAQVFEVAPLLQAHALAALSNGERQLAFDDLLALHRLAEGFANEGSLLAGLIALSSQALVHEAVDYGRSREVWAAGDYAEFQRWLAAINPLGILRQGLRLERTLLRHLLAETPELVGPLIADESGPSAFGGFVGRFGHGWALQASVHTDGYFAHLMNALRLQETPPRLDPAGLEAFRRAVDADSRSWSPARRLASRLTPDLASILETSTAEAARFVLFSARCALERHRLEHGRYPDSLAALVPGKLPAVPVNPSTGSAAAYRPLEAGGYLLEFPANATPPAPAR